MGFCLTELNTTKTKPAFTFANQRNAPKWDYTKIELHLYPTKPENRSRPCKGPVINYGQGGAG